MKERQQKAEERRGRIEKREGKGKGEKRRERKRKGGK